MEDTKKKFLIVVNAKKKVKYVIGTESAENREGVQSGETKWGRMGREVL